MTETQFIYYGAPLLLFIMAAISIAITSFFYLEFKEKKVVFTEVDIEATKKAREKVEKILDELVTGLDYAPE